MVTRICRITATPACRWSSYGKHAPFSGMTKDDTLHPSPARYLPGYGPRQIEAVESETVRRPDQRNVTAEFKAEYLRNMNEVIGWDEGDDATLSYVECSGGDAVRSYHGRPMRKDNRKTRGPWGDVTT
jgi:hypothetical protein